MSKLETRDVARDGSAMPRGKAINEITLTVNGTSHTVSCAPHATLLAVLRGLGLFSVRFGSATGETGAAAVLVDGRHVSCDVLLPRRRSATR